MPPPAAAPLALRSRGPTALAAVPSRAPCKRAVLDVAAYVEAKASGSTEAEAMRAAGAKSKSPATLARRAGRFEARPDVRAALAEARQGVAATTTRAWRTGVARIEKILEDPRSSNLDVLGAVAFLAKLRGEYAPAKVAVKAETETRVLVAFADMAGRVPGEDLDPDPLPHVVAPDGGGIPGE